MLNKLWLIPPASVARNKEKIEGVEYSSVLVLLGFGCLSPPQAKDGNAPKPCYFIEIQNRPVVEKRQKNVQEEEGQRT